MSRHRRAAKIDSNQPEIVKKLRQIPGVSVELGHDDILVGFRKITFWYELKDESAVSNKTGKILESEIKPDQKRIRGTFTGHYKIVSSYNQIITDIGTVFPEILIYLEP